MSIEPGDSMMVILSALDTGGRFTVQREPMIWSGHGVTEAGAVSKALVENVDLGLTLASLCGLPPMDWIAADGKECNGFGVRDRIAKGAVNYL